MIFVFSAFILSGQQVIGEIGLGLPSPAPASEVAHSRAAGHLLWARRGRGCRWP